LRSPTLRTGLPSNWEISFEDSHDTVGFVANGTAVMDTRSDVLRREHRDDGEDSLWTSAKFCA